MTASRRDQKNDQEAASGGPSAVMCSTGRAVDEAATGGSSSPMRGPTLPMEAQSRTRRVTP